MLQNLIQSFAQFLKSQKHFSLELLFDKLPHSFNGIEFRAMGWLTNGNQVIRPVQSTGHMSPRLVKLNKCDVISQLMSEGINKLLKSLSIEAIVFLTKMPAAQRFDHPVEPKIVTFPEYRCVRFHSKRHNHFPCFCFKSQAGLVLTQVTQPLSLSKQALIGQQGWGDVFLKR